MERTKNLPIPLLGNQKKSTLREGAAKQDESAENLWINYDLTAVCRLYTEEMVDNGLFGSPLGDILALVISLSQTKLLLFVYVRIDWGALVGINPGLVQTQAELREYFHQLRKCIIGVLCRDHIIWFGIDMQIDLL